VPVQSPVFSIGSAALSSPCLALAIGAVFPGPSDPYPYLPTLFPPLFGRFGTSAPIPGLLPFHNDFNPVTLGFCLPPGRSPPPSFFTQVDGG